MTDDNPIACSLGAGELEQRFAAIAEVGVDSLISSEAEGDRHLLRFRPSGATRKQLEEIVIAEAECCSFLDLSLSEERGDLVLTIAAPQEAQALARALAAAFAGVARGAQGETRGRALAASRAAASQGPVTCSTSPPASGTATEVDS